MELKFQVQTKVQKPIAEVFDAVHNAEKITRYFATGGASAPLNEGTTVVWQFADFPGDVPVHVKRVVRNELITFEWEAAESGEVDLTKPNELPPPVGYNTTVEMRFTATAPDETLVSISERGWRENQGALSSSYGNCQGWSQMLCFLMAYLEYGINLRNGAY